MVEITRLRQYIGATVVYFLNRHSNLRIFGGGSPHVAYSKSQLDAPIYWSCYSWEEHFVPALPIRHEIAYKLCWY